MQNIPCAICGSQHNYSVLYPANFSQRDFTEKTFSARRTPDKIHYQIVKCKADGLIYSNPILDLKKITRLYEHSKFTYANETVNLSKSYIHVLKPVLKQLRKTDRILEIGCGNGFILNDLYQLGYHNVYGIEPSQHAVDQANPKIKKNIIVDYFHQSIIKKGHYDFIFFFQTLDHIPDPNQFISGCYYALRPRGKILAFNHNVNSFSALLLKEKSPIIDIEHIYLFNKKTMRLIFEKNGFIIDQIFSPNNTISLSYFVHLLPLPIGLKTMLLNTSNLLIKTLLKLNITMPLGNICLVASK